MPPGDKWVYAENNDQIQRSGTMAQGVSQVSDKDFADNHVPESTNLAFRVAHIILIFMKLHLHI
jgi:hypothetical protein